MDGDAVRQSETALRKTVAALEAQLASAQSEGTQLVAVPDGAGQLPPAAKTKEASLKELAGDESLSEEARDTAMKALEALVASQLQEIEQTAAVKKLESEQKKRSAALKDMESEAQFIESEQSVVLEKMESEVQFINQQAFVEQKKSKAEADAQRRKTTTDRDAERRMAAAERRQKLQAEIEEEVEAEMAEWLGRHRLSRHAEAIADVVGM